MSCEELRDDLASPLGAGMIGLPQGGRAQDAIKWLTPDMFGALGDGVADDTVPFALAAGQAIADDAGLVIPAGTYRIGGLPTPLTQTLRIVLKPGAVIQGKDLTSDILFPLGDGVSLEVTGAGLITGFCKVHDIDATAGRVDLGSIRYEGVRLHGNRIAGHFTKAENISLGRFILEGVSVRDGWSGFNMSFDCSGGWVSNSEFIDLVVPADAPNLPNLNGYAVAYGYYLSPDAANFFATGNLIDHVGDLRDGRQANGFRCIADAVHYRGNTIRNIVTGDSNRDNCEGLYAYARRAIATGNVLINAGRNQAAIAFKGGGALPGGTDSPFGGRDSIIAHNVITFDDSHGDDACGILVSTKNCLVDHNILVGVGMVGQVNVDNGNRNMWGGISIDRKGVESVSVRHNLIHCRGNVGIHNTGWGNLEVHGNRIHVTSEMDTGGGYDRYGILTTLRGEAGDDSALDQGAQIVSLMDNDIRVTKTGVPAREAGIGLIRKSGATNATFGRIAIKRNEISARQAYYIPNNAGVVIDDLIFEGNDYTQVSSGLFNGIFATPAGRYVKDFRGFEGEELCNLTTSVDHTVLGRRRRQVVTALPGNRYIRLRSAQAVEGSEVLVILTAAGASGPTLSLRNEANDVIASRATAGVMRAVYSEIIGDWVAL